MQGQPLPPLPTLGARPSWVNRTGRVDRSACVEMRASEVWREAALKPARTGSGREAAGQVTVDAGFVFSRHQRRKPFGLEGDLRTDKANAMKDPRWEKWRRETAETAETAERDKGDSRAARGGGTSARGSATRGRRMTSGDDGSERLAYGNPNKGATRTKKLGLWDGTEPAFESAGPWRQVIRVERWRLHARLAQHFLICPACGGKFLKLFMILCSEDELRDAELAEGWINMVDARRAAARRPLDRETAQQRARLIDRERCAQAA